MFFCMIDGENISEKELYRYIKSVIPLECRGYTFLCLARCGVDDALALPRLDCNNFVVMIGKQIKDSLCLFIVYHPLSWFFTQNTLFTIV